MRKIFLLRHAQAETMAGEEDFERKLSPRGRQQALDVAALMAQEDWRPDKILCSPARRTRQTCRPILDQWPESRACYEDKLYLGTAGTLYRYLQESDDECGSILLVAHNPGIHDLAQFLLGGGPEHMVIQLAMQYRPATLAVFGCPCETWADLMPAQNQLLALQTIES